MSGPLPARDASPLSIQMKIPPVSELEALSTGSYKYTITLHWILFVDNWSTTTPFKGRWRLLKPQSTESATEFVIFRFFCHHNRFILSNAASYRSSKCSPCNITSVIYPITKNLANTGEASNNLKRMSAFDYVRVLQKKLMIFFSELVITKSDLMQKMFLLWHINPDFNI